MKIHGFGLKLVCLDFQVWWQCQNFDDVPGREHGNLSSNPCGNPS